MISAATDVICPACRTSYDATANFCPRCGSALRAADSADVDPLLGRLIDGRYRVIERIGAGGMGVVYKVEHQRMGKIAAMKVLHRELAKDKEITKRFRREAEAVSQLTHPNTVQTFDFGATPDGALYLIMELVRGEDLGSILKRDGAMPFRRAAPILMQVCGALGEAHELGIIHRDLKPENILVSHTKDGQDHVKVLDFGLAKLTEREDFAEVTGKGEVIGTPYYMSPEQIRGEDLDARSDIYSLGALMYRVLAGEPVFAAKTPVGVLTKHLTDPPVPLRTRAPELDPHVEAVVMRCLAKQPDHRFSTVDAVREALAPLYEAARAAPMPRAPSDGGVGPTPTPRRIERRQSTSAEAQRLKREDFDAYERSLRRQNRVRTIVIPLILVVAAAGGIVWWRLDAQAPRQREVEPNNDLGTATIVAAGEQVRGKIRKRLAPDQGDRDFFELATGARPDAPARLSVKLEPLPNMDLAVAVYDENGRILAVGDALGVGEPESIPNLRVTADRLFVAVQESREGPPHFPSENVSDEYTLEVRIGQPTDGEELEPNDVDSDATPLRTTMKGFLGKPQDVDKYRWAGGPGPAEVELVGPEGVTARLRLPDGTLAKARKARLVLKPGDVIAVERVDERKGDARPVARGVDAPYTITVRAAK